MKKTIVLLILIVLCLGQLQAQREANNAAVKQDLEPFIKEVLTEWKNPKIMIDFPGIENRNILLLPPNQFFYDYAKKNDPGSFVEFQNNGGAFVNKNYAVAMAEFLANGNQEYPPSLKDIKVPYYSNYSEWKLSNDIICENKKNLEYTDRNNSGFTPQEQSIMDKWQKEAAMPNGGRIRPEDTGNVVPGGMIRLKDGKRVLMPKPQAIGGKIIGKPIDLKIIELTGK